ncbi:MAG: hypothetical protein CML66_25795 [Rhodobacteraceae bacterium]|nr:hypothetical protein [Paracoccaceae bacterium]MAY44663.1 hypothetical protein [Paracoccaceae bacterium]|tara:strand:- start:401 stop:607 length:207 start_codon:yes stop_codon:yes gene_type:complete
MADLIDDIEAFLERKQMAATAFGREAMGDPSFVFELRSGRDYRRSTEQKVREFMAGWKSQSGHMKAAE